MSGLGTRPPTPTVAAQGLLARWRAGEMRLVTADTPKAARQPRPHIPAGPERIKQMMRVWLREFLDSEAADLRAWAACEAPQPWRIGSICSGTEMPSLCWAAFRDALWEEMNVILFIETSFVCEKDRKKQDFIRQMHPSVTTCFEDARDLEREAAANIFESSKALQPVRGVSHIVAGFPCDDASRLSRDHLSSSNMSCVLDGTLRTGRVLHDIIAYAQNHLADLSLMILENVTALLKRPRDGPSNADAAAALIRSCLQCHVHVWKLDPWMFGSPQVRGRLYFLVLPLSPPCFDGDLQPQVVDQELATLMVRLVGFSMTPIEGYLLCESDPLVRAKYDFLEARDASAAGDVVGCSLAGGSPAACVRLPQARTSKSQTMWVQRHQRAFEARGIDWHQSLHLALSPSTLACCPGIRALSCREIDLLTHAGVNTFPEASMRTLELSQQLGREVPRTDHFTTLKPEHRKYLTGRARLLFGLESLRLQDIWFDPCPRVQAKLRSFPDGMLSDIAGNAFDASCYCASLFAGVMLISRGASARARRRMVAQAKDEPPRQSE